ncbi:MAG: short-chain dehydrogenase, partial [Noviherbaspirillum sp.]
TPQFDWGRTCMPNKPKPLGKIFQPEVAARSIYWAATHRRREWWVGFPALEAILGTRLLAGYLDRRLAFQAYEGQQSADPVAPGRRDNLYQPVTGEHRTHGRFDASAVGWSWEFWLSKRRVPAAACALVLGAVAWRAVGHSARAGSGGK